MNENISLLARSKNQEDQDLLVEIIIQKSTPSDFLAYMVILKEEFSTSLNNMDLQNKFMEHFRSEISSDRLKEFTEYTATDLYRLATVKFQSLENIYAAERLYINFIKAKTHQVIAMIEDPIPNDIDTEL